MSRVPGTFSDGPPGNIRWDENDPPPYYKCSQGPMHLEDCNGNCGVAGYLTKIQVDYHNELREWIRAGMHPGKLGTPTTLWDLEIKFNTLINALAEAKLINLDELSETYTETKTTIMKDVRKNVQSQGQILTPQKVLFGPNGEIIH